MTDRIEKTIKALQANNMEVFYAENKEAIPDIVKGILKRVTPFLAAARSLLKNVK